MLNLLNLFLSVVWFLLAGRYFFTQDDMTWWVAGIVCIAMGLHELVRWLNKGLE